MKITPLQAVRLCGLFAIAYCSSYAYSAPHIPTELRQHSVVYCTQADGFSFNPQRADAGSNMNVVTEQIFDKLVEFNPQTNQIQPALVEHFEWSDDGLTMRLNLRRDVAFHQTPWFTPTRKLNAEDVIFSLNRLMGKNFEVAELSPEEQESLARYQINKEIAEGTHFPYFDSTRLKNRIKAVYATGNYSLNIVLDAPYPALLDHLASQYAVILSKEYALQLNADANLLQLDRLPVGTGRYQVDSYVQNDHIRLKPNPNYWGKKAKTENMIIDFSTSGTGRMTKFLNGECDIAAFPEPSQLAVAKKYGIISKNAGANLAFLAFNMQRPQMQNEAIRHHIAQGINRGRLTRSLFYGTAQMAYQVLPRGLLGNQRNGYPYVPRPIGKLLPESHRLNLWVIDEKRVYNPHPMKMAELIRADLAKIGINLNVRQVSRAYLVQQLEKNEADYDLILGGWLANNFDLDSFLFPILSCKVQKSVTNLSNWCHPEFDELLNQAQLSQDPQEQQQLYQQAELLLQKRLPILPLVHADRLLLVSQSLQEVPISQFGQVDLSAIEQKSPEREGK